MAYLLLALYAFADRFAGGGLPALDKVLPGRAAFWGALLCAGSGYLLLGYQGAAFAAVWLAYRTPPWKVPPGSSATPRGPFEITMTLVRHAVPVLAGAFIIAKGFGLDLRTLLPFAAFAVFATALAAAYAKVRRKPERFNAILEAARGAAFGVAVLFACGALP